MTRNLYLCGDGEFAGDEVARIGGLKIISYCICNILQAFQERLSQRQKLLWGNLMGSLSDKSREEVEAAEQALESLKDTSALLSSEIAEHLSPAEAIKAADDAHVAAQKATDAISSCRTNLVLSGLVFPSIWRLDDRGFLGI